MGVARRTVRVQIEIHEDYERNIYSPAIGGEAFYEDGTTGDLTAEEFQLALLRGLKITEDPGFVSALVHAVVERRSARVSDFS